MPPLIIKCFKISSFVDYFKYLQKSNQYKDSYVSLEDYLICGEGYLSAKDDKHTLVDKIFNFFKIF